MPNKCIMCGKIHPDFADYLMEGCDNCGSKFFFFIRQEELKKAEKDLEKLSKSEIKEIEEDIRDIVESEGVESTDTVILDIEAIRVIRAGKYEIDVSTLFNQNPIVIRIGPGKYEIDLSTMMEKWKKKHEKKD